MKLLDVTRKGLAIGLAAQLVLATELATAAQAEMLSTDTAISKYAAQANRASLLSEIKKQDVRDQLVALGVDPAEAEARLNALSDEEVASMLSQVDDQSAGAGGIVGAFVTVFLILLVTDFLCLTKVFNFTRCVR